MPTYDYRCKKCGEQFEVSQGMHEPRLTTHDDCGGDVERVFAPWSYNKHQGLPNVKVDRNPKGEAVAKTTEHWDGRQDVVVKPTSIKTKFVNSDD